MRARFRASASTVVPGRWQVYDYEVGEVARRSDGSLAYFRTRADAHQWASKMNGRTTKGTTMSIIGATTDPCNNCGATPAVRAFHNGSATNWFSCTSCDALVASHFQCLGCGQLHHSLLNATDCCSITVKLPTELHHGRDHAH